MHYTNGEPKCIIWYECIELVMGINNTIFKFGIAMLHQEHIESLSLGFDVLLVTHKTFIATQNYITTTYGMGLYALDILKNDYK